MRALRGRNAYADAFYRQHAGNGWQTVGLAIDQPSSVRKFLERTPVTFPIGLAGLEGTGLTRSLGNEAGGLPCPVVQVSSDNPVLACMASQYAGWQVSVGKFFAMGSGPMRAAWGKEELEGFIR